MGLRPQLRRQRRPQQDGVEVAAVVCVVDALAILRGCTLPPRVSSDQKARERDEGKLDHGCRAFNWDEIAESRRPAVHSAPAATVISATCGTYWVPAIRASANAPTQPIVKAAMRCGLPIGPRKSWPKPSVPPSARI